MELPHAPGGRTIYNENAINAGGIFLRPLRGLTLFLIYTPGQGQGLKSYRPYGTCHNPAQEFYRQANELRGIFLRERSLFPDTEILLPV